MAEGTKLTMTFNCTDGKSHDFSYKYAKSEPGLTNVKALTAGIITNGSIFANVPVSVESAKLVVTTESEFNLDD